MTRIATIIFSLAMTTLAHAADVRTVDGDTLRIGQTRVRLFGIDAPETHQTCQDGWRAGIEATRAMKALLEGHSVNCETRGYDKYGRTIALCRADGVDIGAEMVRKGYAWVFSKYSHDYEPQEAQAKAEGLGIHAHGCEPAWDWRRSHK